MTSTWLDILMKIIQVWLGTCSTHSPVSSDYLGFVSVCPACWRFHQTWACCFDRSAWTPAQGSHHRATLSPAVPAFRGGFILETSHAEVTDILASPQRDMPDSEELRFKGTGWACLVLVGESHPRMFLNWLHLYKILYVWITRILLPSWLLLIYSSLIPTGLGT